MSSPIPIDPYEVLGVSRNAELSAIRAAHRKLALKHHPDRIKDEAERKKGTEEFQKAQQAYELLSDEKRRARYDDQVRLAQLKKEAMMDRGGHGRSASYPMPHPAPPPRTQTSTTYDFQNGRIYEERRPRHSDEDDRYAEPPRPTSRKTSGYERKPSTTYAEDKKKKHSEKPSSGFTSFVESKLREKARQAKEAAKARDKDRRRDSFDKYTRKTAYVEEDSSSDSEPIFVQRKPEPTRRKAYYEAPPRKRQESPPPRRRQPRRVVSESSSSDSEGDYDSSRDEWARRHRDATNYISERSVNGRPSVLRTDSAKYYNIPRERSSGRKSGSDKDDRREERPRSSKGSKPAEVADPPRRNPQSRKPPPISTTKSSPGNLKGMTRDAPQPQRSTTGEYPSDHRRPFPGMNRANTMPIPTSGRKEGSGARSSKLKHGETHDSGYGSSGPATPELHGTSPPKSGKTTSSKYFIVEEDPEHSRGGFRTVPVGDGHNARRTRSPSPIREREDRHDKDRKRTERPNVQVNTSHGTPRSSPYAASPEQLSSRPGPFRTDSSRSAAPRETPPLSRGDSGSRRVVSETPKDDGYRFKPENVRYSPQLSAENLKHARRGAADVRDRDFFPGSSHHDTLHGSKPARRESAY